uniref:Uncharacterized protein n=1 Tax=Panagrolaimus sp. ES5 TaxID=591445 RepID=A0AC34FBI6_9BILA
MYSESKDWLMAARVDDCSRSNFQCRPESLIPHFASAFKSFDKSFDNFVNVGEKRSKGIENFQRALNQWKNELSIMPATAAHIATTSAPQSNSILAKIKRTIKKFTSLFSKSEKTKVAQPETFKSVPKTEFQKSMEEFEGSLNIFKMDTNKFQSSSLDFQKAVKQFKDSVEAAVRKYH